jgi:hypothetical protein
MFDSISGWIMYMYWYLFPLLLGGVAGVLLVVGIIGRRVDDHPRCRRCRFDLSGLPATSKLCSECGADIRLAGATLRGTRVVRRRAIAAAVPLLILAVCAGIGINWLGSHPNWLEEHKSVSQLISELGRPQTQQKSMAELERRLSLGSLAANDIDRISDLSLANRSMPTGFWDDMWGEWLVHAQQAGRLSSGRWARYVVGKFNFRVDVRPTVERGDPVPVRISWTNAQGMFLLSGFNVSIDLGNGITIPVSHTSRNPQEPTEAFFLLDDPRIKALSDGPHPLKAAVIVSADDVVPIPPFNSRGAQSCKLVPLPPSSWGTLSATWSLTSEHTPVKINREESVAWMQKEAITAVATWPPYLGGFSFPPGWNDGAVVAVRGEEPAVTMACDVVIVDGGKETPLGPIVLPAGSNSSAYLDIPKGLIHGKSVKVLLRPNPAIARNQLTIVPEIWGDEIDIPDVELVSHEPVEQPSQTSGSSLRKTPISQLMSTASGSGDPSVCEPAAAELSRRMTVCRFTSAEEETVVAWALTYQGDQSLPWYVEVGDIIDRARDSGRLSAERLKQYARQSVVWGLQAPATAKVGQAFDVVLRMKPVRLGSQARFGFGYAYKEITLSGRVIRPAFQGQSLDSKFELQGSGDLGDRSDSESVNASETGVQTVSWMVETVFWEPLGDPSQLDFVDLIVRTKAPVSASIVVRAP